MWERSKPTAGLLKRASLLLFLFRKGQGRTVLPARMGRALSSCARSASKKVRPTMSLHLTSHQRAARLVSYCARPTRGVLDRALREHRRLTGRPPSSLPPLPAHPTAHAAEISAEPALPAAPILSSSQSRIGMSQIRTAEPPEKPQGSAGSGDGDPEPQSAKVGFFR